MKRLFLSITKGEELRFLGHLDFLRTMERAVMRSEIPVAFSEGFNPHMKLSLDSALGVGVTADPLYLEIKLEEDMSTEEVRERLSRQLPRGDYHPFHCGSGKELAQVCGSFQRRCL